MIRRILLLSLTQAFRSIAVVLFPVAFFILFAWATAGSASGNTTDPIRASLWFWLGAHLVRFRLWLPPNGTAGALSYLPIGAAFFPFWAARSSFKKLVMQLERSRAPRIFFLLFYTGMATLIAWLSQTRGVEPNLYYAAGCSFAIAALGTVTYGSEHARFFRAPGYLLVAMWGLGAIAVGVSLIVHWSVVRDLSTVIQPGWVGGILFTLVQILYIPNLALSALSYVLGFGFSLGAGTHISPAHFTLHEIPALPLLGSLPTKLHPLAIAFGIVPVLSAMLVVLLINRTNLSFRSRQWELLSVLIFTATVVIAFSYLNHGALITYSMNPIGISWWQVASIATGALVVAACLLQYLPASVRKLRERQS